MNGNEMCEGICCGCTACQSICPKGAINIVEDQKGFLQPIINEDLCVDCNLCKKTCNEYIKKNEITDVFLIKLKDNIQHTISQSGGAFTAISDVLLTFPTVALRRSSIVYRNSMSGGRIIKIFIN